MSEVVVNVTKVEEVVTINATPNVTQILVNTNSGGGIQSIVAGTNVTIDNTDPANPIISASGGGGGAVDSVNGQTGVVVLDADDIADTATNVFVSPAEKTAITHTNRSILDAITESFTTALKTTYDDASAWVTDVGLQLKTDFDALIATGSRLITSTEITKLSNTSGTNTGDNATNTTSNAYADSKVADAINDGTTTIAPSQNAVFDALALKQDSLTWVDYSALTITVGWSSFTQKRLWYLDFGSHILLYYHLVGNGSGINSSFKAPFTATEESYSQHIVMSNGTFITNPGRGQINSGSNIVNLFATIPGSTWSAGASTKIASGIIIYKK